MRALLIRHAASSGQAPDALLSEDGAAQAKALVPVLEALRAGPLYTSPYARARDTMAPYAQASGQVVTQLDGLRERVLSTQTLPDWQDHIRASYADPAYAPERGESLNALCARAAPALRLIKSLGGGLPAFVTHGQLTSALFAACDRGFGFDDWRALRNPDVFEVALKDGRIIQFNRIDIKAQA